MNISNKTFLNIPDLSSLAVSWKGEHLSKNQSIWLKEFNKKEIVELENASLNFLKTNENLSEINIKNFILPTLSNFLISLRDELKNGIGFKLLRGIPVKKYKIKQLAAIYIGIGKYIGSLRS